jgi:hypothetical protein
VKHLWRPDLHSFRLIDASANASTIVVYGNVGYIGSSQNLAAVTEIIAKLENHGSPFFGM